MSVDSTINRAHQHAAGARKRGRKRQTNRDMHSRSMLGQALGRSRGGLTRMVHLAADGRGLPLAIVATPGDVNDSTVFDTVLEAVRVPRLSAGRPRCRPETVIADRAIRHGPYGRATTTWHPSGHP